MEKKSWLQQLWQIFPESLRDFLKPFNIVTLILAFIGIKQYIHIPSMNINMSNISIEPYIILALAGLLIYNNLIVSKKIRKLSTSLDWINLKQKVENIDNSTQNIGDDIEAAEQRAKNYAVLIFNENKTYASNLDTRITAQIEKLREDLKDEFAYIKLKSR